MSKKFNQEIRDFVEEHHMFMYQVPQIMGISESLFIKRMREEWTDEEKNRVLSLLEEYVAGGTNDRG